MPRFLVKPFKIGLLVLLPLVLISNHGEEIPLEKSESLHGAYHIHTLGDSPIDFSGSAVYENAFAKNINGPSWSTLTIKFEDNSVGNQYAMELFISKKVSSEELSTGTYKVSRDIKGFVGNFNGVFGYANLKKLGELPYFTKQGAIHISRIGNGFLEGSMEMLMNNTEGEEISLYGHFRATQ